MGRELIFSDPMVVQIVKKYFVPVAGDDWYQRRRDDAEGNFFRSVADQGPRKGKGGSTRQGIYVFTAGGKLLAYRNHHDPLVMIKVMMHGLTAWNSLPPSETKAAAVKVPALDDLDMKYDRSPPKGTLIVDVFTRILDKNKDGTYQPGTCSFPGGDKAARDHLWLLESEWRGLIPENPQKGQTMALPKRLLLRIMRFHMSDNTRGEPPMWSRNQIRSAKITLTVTDVNKKAVALRLQGQGVMATDADLKTAKRGFDVQLLGYLHYDSQQDKIDRFDVVAVGDHWGAGPYTRNPRRGKAPLGIAFRLAEDNAPANLVPPQGARYLPGYLHPDKH